MTFQQLRYYVVLCEKGSFSKAAECLYISQQGLSMAISNLEKEFSSQFLIRSSKGLKMTKDGEFFLEWSKDMLEEVQRCWDHFEGRDSKTGVLDIIAVQGALSEFGAKLVNSFEEKYTKLTVHYHEAMSLQVDELVRSGEYDIGFGIEPIDPDIFECHRIYVTPLALVVHNSHPFAKLDTIPMALLQNQPLVTLDENAKSVRFFLGECEKRGLKVKPKFRVRELSTVHRLVKENLGIGLTTVTAAEALQTASTTYRCFAEDNLYWAVDIFKLKSRKLSLSYRMFFEYCQRQLSYDEKNKIAPESFLESEINRT